MNRSLTELEYKLQHIQKRIEFKKKKKQSHLYTEEINDYLKQEKNLLININQLKQKGGDYD